MIPAEQRLLDFKANIASGGVRAQRQKAKKMKEKLRGELEAGSDYESEKSDAQSDGTAISGDPFVKQQARLQQRNNEKAQVFQSAATRELGIIQHEVGILNNQIRMSLVTSRHQLGPFIDEGFCHQNRANKRFIKSKPMKDDSRFEEGKGLSMDIVLELKIKQYRDIIQSHM